MPDPSPGASPPPLFILGTERSGSNLLRLLLDSHPRIVIPHPPHVMRYFAPIVPGYGDLGTAGRFRRLVDDVLVLVRAHIHPWPWVPDAAELVRRARPEPGTGKLDLFSVYAALHEAVRDHDLGPDGGRWGCKSTFMIEHAERILAEWPNARLLWLYRDPRDVAASSRESVFSAFHPRMTAELWTRQQDQGLALEARGVPLLRIRYEDLVAPGAAEAQVRRICEYVGEAFHPPMLEFFKGKEAQRSSGLSESWKHTAAPIRGDALDRWRKDLTDEEVLAVESAAGETMEALGYVPARSAEQRATGPSALQRARWTLSDWASWLTVEWRSLRKDKNVGLRWRRYWVVQRVKLLLVLNGP
ncbi:MAG: sulfotransferase [Myxococcales bacterium]|nr:sulfotransferase [Myxococcales bacterium]